MVGSVPIIIPVIILLSVAAAVLWKVGPDLIYLAIHWLMGGELD